MAQATELVDYLADLGISDLYASPLLQATPESTHGYDVCGFGALHPNLGKQADFDALVSALQAHQMGLLLDIVPNHMSASLANSWWLDVLENGPASLYASWFDIDWHPADLRVQNKVLIPVLEDDYPKVLEAGKLRLVFKQGRFGIGYHERIFPVAPASYRPILQRLVGQEGNSEPIKNLAAFIGPAGSQQESSALSQSEFHELKERLRIWSESSLDFQESLASTMNVINGNPGQPQSFEFLDALVHKQHYQLVNWRKGPDEINYRRFFDVTELVSLRMELPEVFRETHHLVLDWIRHGKITGLRVDHPDGLWNPKQYFERLQGACGVPFYIVVEKILTAQEPLPNDWPVAGTTGYDFLNRLNAIFIQTANAAAFDTLYSRFCSDGDAISDVPPESPPSPASFESAAYAGKRQALHSSFTADLRRLALHLEQIARLTQKGHDLTFDQLHHALFEVIAAFPVYRTYVSDESHALPDYQTQYVIEAVSNAKRQNPDSGHHASFYNAAQGLSNTAQDFKPGSSAQTTATRTDGRKDTEAVDSRKITCNRDLDPRALNLIKTLVLLDFPEDLDETARARCRWWVMRFQQLTAPVMAKGVEDTAFYNYNRLVSLNEVGGDPASFGTGVDAFHEANTRNAELWPHSLLATATHDTKRGEDLRARLNVLSEMPQQWAQAISRWRELNAPLKRKINGQPAPHPNDEYLLYQTLVGAWTSEASGPAGRKALCERVCSYIRKALKESKARTSWTSPNADYERAMIDFITVLLTDAPHNRFLEDFKAFQQKVAFFGTFNSLSQLLLKLTCPGVPDIYQGTELWDFNLVDPDNRRPVNFELRKQLLSQLKHRSVPGEQRGEWLEHLLAVPETGAIKLFVLWQVLQLRSRHPDLFHQGSYIPLKPNGVKKNHLCAFARELKGRHIIVVAPRLVFTLMDGAAHPPLGDDCWSDTWLPLPFPPTQRPYVNLFTGETATHTRNRLQLSDVLKTFPLALLAFAEISFT